MKKIILLSVAMSFSMACGGFYLDRDGEWLYKTTLTRKTNSMSRCSELPLTYTTKFSVLVVNGYVKRVVHHSLPEMFPLGDKQVRDILAFSEDYLTELSGLRYIFMGVVTPHEIGAGSIFTIAHLRLPTGGNCFDDYYVSGVRELQYWN